MILSTPRFWLLGGLIVSSTQLVQGAEIGADPFTAAHGAPLFLAIGTSGQANILEDDLPTLEAAKPQVAPQAPRRTTPVQAAPDPVLEAQRREEMRLWQWLQMEEYQRMDSKITELKRISPEWNPPDKMMELLEAGKNKKELDQAMANGDWRSIVYLSQRDPGLFTCEQYYNLWTLADAYYELDDPDSTRQIYLSMMKDCREDETRVNTFRRAQQQLTAAEIDAMYEQEDTRTSNRISQSNLTLMKRELMRTRVLNAARDGDDGVVIDAIPDFEEEVMSQRDSGFALMFGWALYRDEQLIQAEEWFQRAHDWTPSEQTTRAMATIQGRLGNLDEAELLARNNISDPLMSEMLGSILSQRASAAFNEEDYESTIAYLKEAEQYAPRSLDDEAMYGWASYHMGDKDSAALAFEKAYRENPTEDVAQGLYYSLYDTDRVQLEKTAEDQSGPLQELLTVKNSEEAYNTGRYLTAYDEAPDKYPELKGVSSPGLMGGMLFYFRSGDSGTSQLDTQRLPLLSGEFSYRRHMFDLQLSGVNLSSGSLEDYSLVGNYPGQEEDYGYTPTTEISNAVDVKFDYRYEGKVSPYFSIGLTPSNAPISARTEGALGVDFQMQRGNINLELFSRSVKESILSYVGMYDPYDGEAWGAVSSKGVRAGVFLDLSNNYGAALGLKSASLTGTQVASNDEMEFSLRAQKQWTGDSWERITLGPTFTFQRFDQNLSKYTIGHGGYFSPQQLFKYGGELSAQTREQRNFVARGKISFGYQQHQEDCAPLLPLESSLCSEFYTDNEASGMYMGFELVGMVQADPRAQLGGGVFYGLSPDFNEFGFMLAVRLTLDSRRFVLASDLPNWSSSIR
ncbi:MULTISPECIES: cellulose synthase subunit BcsC-related outer membrane protein [unclassified Oceanobacter]|uniref:cellulose synthase subunit BcsC-related outer membrane protein n=1 Tax=unclassified Oceanobacter TaxID=2620260 RepID=UPI002733C8BD|nr:MULTISPECIES: cellulose synthase subunit BcsC-related outer membrane protein [unclassified Oceanobacter]MDP2506248.1 cellulose synthase subunit BcsC-related outer membrane protein [Oceanobacter sp. 3_MG-2023]MDP2546490.1 cellulose synthase subunit BcsC-related outer membrane protein [Oceanobacter sp. 4_MG-2023]